MPMNLAPTNPPVTPPRRGTGQPVLLPSWEGLGVGSAAQCANKIRGILSLRERVRVRVNGANEALAYRTFPGSVEPVDFPFWSFFRHSSFVIRHFVYSRHETFQPGHSPGTRIRSSAALRPAQACEVSRCGAQIPALGTGGLRADAAWHGVVSVESATGEHLRFRGLQEGHADGLRRGWRGDLHLRARFSGRAGA